MSRFTRLLSWITPLFKWIGTRIFPERAATQTWMILTFVLFVGAAVVVVMGYVYVLQSEVRQTLRDDLRERTEQIALQIEQAESLGERLALARAMTHASGLRITVIDGSEVLIDMQNQRLLSDGRLLNQPEIRVDVETPLRFAKRPNAEGIPVLFASLYRPNSGLIVRVGETETSLERLTYRLSWSLLFSIGLAFVLSLIGSWVASQRITKPLQAIRNSAVNIIEGEYDEKILVESRAAEFQDLAQHLNRMSEQYREKIEELQRLAQLQNEFIGNVSHEVRNPIFAVGGYLEALASPSLKPEQRTKYAEKGLFNLQRLNNLFNDLIEIARLEYREDLIKSKTFDLGELINEICETLSTKAANKGLTLNFDNPHLLVQADRNRIRQVLINLIENAIAYTDEGSVRVRFRRHVDKVRVEVIDTGRGIPEEHLDRIFERFHRVDPDRSRKSGGTGLGLSIVKQILHAHHSNIQVESTRNRGSRFWFELPYVEASDEIAA